MDLADEASRGPEKAGSRPSFERAGLLSLALLLVAPVVAQALFRPLTHALGPATSASEITLMSLVTTAIVLATWLLPRGRGRGRGRGWWWPMSAGALVVAAASLARPLGLAGGLTLVLVTASVAALLPFVAARLPASLDGLSRRHRVTAALFTLAALLAIVWTARVSIYMGDPNRPELQAVSGDAFLERHSCLTAYVRALSLAHDRTDNLYADFWYYGSHGLPPLPAGRENPFRPFQIDNFSYPPTFLPLVAPLRLFDGDFPAQRALWFGASALLLAVGLFSVARWIDAPARQRTLLLAPLFFGCVPTLAMLQIGNFHVAAMVLAVLAMVAIESDRPALGGALLAVTILSKLSPGILLLPLLVQRRFRAVAWCAGFGAVLLLASVALFGVHPLVSFVTFALPRLGSGAAFPFMDSDDGVVTNMSPFGIPFKLALFGVHLGDPWTTGRVVARVFTLVLVVVSWVSARRFHDRTDRAVSWMSLLVLASFQSPFAPAYGAFTLLWATTLLAAKVRARRGVIGLVTLWAIALVVPQHLSLAQHAAHALFQSSIVIGVCLWLVTRPRRA